MVLVFIPALIGHSYRHLFVSRVSIQWLRVLNVNAVVEDMVKWSPYVERPSSTRTKRIQRSTAFLVLISAIFKRADFLAALYSRPIGGGCCTLPSSSDSRSFSQLSIWLSSLSVGMSLRRTSFQSSGSALKPELPTPRPASPGSRFTCSPVSTPASSTRFHR